MYKNKYIKYKTKYLKYKSNKINDLKYKNEIMIGGMFPLYVSMSRLNIENIKESYKEKLIEEAILLNRYYEKKYTDSYKNNTIEKGIAPEQIIDNIKENDLDVDSYETILIIDELIELNKLLNKFNIFTIQSQPSYYINDETFSRPYFQLPFVEFRGNINTIPIMKEIVNHKLLQNYYFTSYPELIDDTPMIRTTVMRPYLSGNYFSKNQEEEDKKKLLYGIYDKDFWNNLICAIREICSKNIVLQEFISNDTDLDTSKDWYILNTKGKLYKIFDKYEMNPFIEDMPLSVLDVRYGNDINLFTRRIDYYSDKSRI